MQIRTSRGYKSLIVLLFEQYELNEQFHITPELDTFIKKTLRNAQPILFIVGENTTYHEKCELMPLIPKQELFHILREYRSILPVCLKVGYAKMGIKKYTTELLYKLLFENLESDEESDYVT